MWVVVVCFCLFLSGLYLYIIIYKISIGIADCSITYYRYEADADLHATSAGDSTCESGHIESKTQTSKHATNRAQRAQALSKQITGLLIVVAQAPLLPDHWSWLKTPNRQRANTPNTKHRELEHTHTHKCETCTQTWHTGVVLVMSTNKHTHHNSTFQC